MSSSEEPWRRVGEQWVMFEVEARRLMRELGFEPRHIQKRRDGENFSVGFGYLVEADAASGPRQLTYVEVPMSRQEWLDLDESNRVTVLQRLRDRLKAIPHAA